MFQVTEKATEMIKEFFKGKDDISPVRIYLSQKGWSGPSLGMALDEPKEDDKIFQNNGITYLVNKELFELVKPINVDFVETILGSGFSISSKLSSEGFCGSSCNY